MASSIGGGDAGEGEWLKIAELRAMAEAQDPHVKEVDSLTLRRFLRARGHVVGKASAMLLKFVAWRREAVPGGVMPAELVRTELSHEMTYMAGTDRAGRPVMLAFPAKHFSATRDMAGFKRYIVYLFDAMCARIPRGQEKFLCVVDLKGWGYANCDVRAYIAAIEILQSYYPERLGKALMIHVPYLFMKAWKLVQPFIDANTRDKFVFVDDKSLEETLRREMEDGQLPEMYGGKMPIVPLA
ncbi:hypothetical protein CFC21_037719 [Triticum aestivum]|uniref:CRAL-TRIO domain-containing protein n=3 Tax=Triticum TaxID=4564 RepID=A0A9R0RWH8_TRITD|nr:phosphatidylinositol transfer protein 3-like [Triticum aestivum]KAF7025545.1 hypothetical protein CFC21_037719 [Triticum aestivum]VAH68140.1 unnamed protein product [Triticum turgidum subsp. durum]